MAEKVLLFASRNEKKRNAHYCNIRLLRLRIIHSKRLRYLAAAHPLVEDKRKMNHDDAAEHDAHDVLQLETGGDSCSFDMWEDNTNQNQSQQQQMRSLMRPASSSDNVAAAARHPAASRFSLENIKHEPSESNASNNTSSRISAMLRALSVASVAVLLLCKIFLSQSRQGRSSQQLQQQQRQQQQRRSFVCITGQLSRLELQNKVATVLEPLRSIGLSPDIALVIDDSISYTTNDQRVSAKYTPAYDSFDEAVQELRRYGYNVITDAPYHQITDPVVTEDYLTFLHHRSSFDESKHMERAQNNVRMLESWSRCYTEMARNVDRMTSYDVVMRIREDSGFLSAIDMEDVVENLQADPKALLSNGCRSEYSGTGMNDKFAILSRHAARAYFTAPFHQFYAAEVDERMKNTERYTYWTYTNAGLHVVRYERIRTIVKLVSDTEGDTVLFHQERKKLSKQCGIEVLDETAPSECVLSWNERKGRMDVASTICWPYEQTTVVESKATSTMEESKGGQDSSKNKDVGSGRNIDESIDGPQKDKEDVVSLQRNTAKAADGGSRLLR